MAKTRAVRKISMEPHVQDVPSPESNLPSVELVTQKETIEYEVLQTEVASELFKECIQKRSIHPEQRIELSSDEEPGKSIHNTVAVHKWSSFCICNTLHPD
ncbi:hypothetical protein V6N13_088837 [Hibiscus sabdariffa]|uniref:Uncharacterized protein n=1 Tax=Hibiscus sabdariffa TaxID=183260 RepID=A0ABR2G0Q5_9ROSI